MIMTDDAEPRLFACYTLLDSIQQDQTILDYIKINEIRFDSIEIYFRVLGIEKGVGNWVIDFIDGNTALSFRFDGNISYDRFIKFVKPLMGYIGRKNATLQ
jgi:hypothetical protein